MRAVEDIHQFENRIVTMYFKLKKELSLLKTIKDFWYIWSTKKNVDNY